MAVLAVDPRSALAVLFLVTLAVYQGRTISRWSSTVASIAGDPHFSAPDGVAFDFHGALDTSFCLTTDKTLQVNALLQGYKDKRPFGEQAADANGEKLRTWMKQIGVLWVDQSGKDKSSGGTPHTLRLVARVSNSSERGAGYLAGVELDGKAVPLPYGAPLVHAGLTLRFGGVKKQMHGGVEEEQDTFYLLVAKQLVAYVTLSPAIKKLRQPNDAEAHFNINFLRIKTTKSIHGVLGQVFRLYKDESRLMQSAPFWSEFQQTQKPIQADQDSGKGYLDGSVQDYATSGVTKPDCKFSEFLK